MFNLLINRRGNTILVAVVAGAIGLGVLTLMMSQISQFSQQVAQSEKEAASAGSNDLTLKFLQKKFQFEETTTTDDNGVESTRVKVADWYPEVYPTPQELDMDPSNFCESSDPQIKDKCVPAKIIAAALDNSKQVPEAARQFLPRITPIPPTSPGTFPTAQIETFLVTKQKKPDASGPCTAIYPPIPKKSLDTTIDCESVSLKGDSSAIGSLQLQTDVSKTNYFQYGMLGIPDPSALTPEQESNSYKANFSWPIEATRGEPVKFLYFVTDPANPRAISKVLVQTSSVLALVPVKAPPPPKCEISLDSSVPHPLNLDSDKSVRFNITVKEGVADTVKILLPNRRETVFTNDQLNRQRLSNWDTPTELKTGGFNVAFLRADQPKYSLVSVSSNPTNCKANPCVEAPWVDTGLDIADGSRLDINTPGTVNYNATGTSDANGNGISGDWPNAKIQPEGAPFENMALLGKIGSNGTPFFVGADYNATVNGASGRLYLVFNEGHGAVIDNSGSLTSSISLSPMPYTTNRFSNNSQFWDVQAQITGFDGQVGYCNTSVEIQSPPAPPKCTLAVADPTITQGQQTQVDIDCTDNEGGPISSVKIGGVALTQTLEKEREVTYQETQKVDDLTRCLSYNRSRVCTSYAKKNIQVTKTRKEKYREITADLSQDQSGAAIRTFSGNYKRKSATGNETVVAEVTGPGGTARPTGELGSVCPFNNPNFNQTLFKAGELFSERDRTERDRVEAAWADLNFQRTWHTYASRGRWWNGYEHRTWNAGNANPGNWDAREDCDATNFCMFLYHANGPWGSPVAHSKGYWVEVGSEDSGKLLVNLVAGTKTLTVTASDFPKLKLGMTLSGKGLPPGAKVAKLDSATFTVTSSRPFTQSLDGASVRYLGNGKLDPNCRVINTKMRHGGCFAGSTKLKMADGSERPVSKIAENDWVFNPLYQAPVRVKSVVKGPEKKPLYEVTLNDKKVVVTEDHPFMTPNGWVQALALKKGELLVGAGSSHQVKSVRKLSYRQPEDVWNFELDTNDPLGHLVLANGIPTGDLTTQQKLKSDKKVLP